ncbi:hypothetical protein CC86DRAFT_385036 [Ophiobolus disseminans]|uniref:Uncharacterized protein n=1 Tax=Ophiobolus disseminans TaxID=1469910 RepID=A0A6A6ZP23_9PLEO|nr:hypothetical protein CC86DRAFT_385036 [Ophiobolus disseminans]
MATKSGSVGSTNIESCHDLPASTINQTPVVQATSLFDALAIAPCPPKSAFVTLPVELKEIIHEHAFLLHGNFDKNIYVDVSRPLTKNRNINNCFPALGCVNNVEHEIALRMFFQTCHLVHPLRCRHASAAEITNRKSNQGTVGIDLYDVNQRFTKMHRRSYRRRHEDLNGAEIVKAYALDKLVECRSVRKITLIPACSDPSLSKALGEMGEWIKSELTKRGNGNLAVELTVPPVTCSMLF